LDCQGMNDLDSSGILALDMVYKFLEQNRIKLYLINLRYPVMKLIKRSHVVDLIGVDHFFLSVFHAHMHIYGRIRLAKNLDLEVPFDYLDENGANLLSFDGVSVDELEKPLNENDQARLAAWDPYKSNAGMHPLRVKKGFELQHPLARITLAPKPEDISLEKIDVKLVNESNGQVA